MRRARLPGLLTTLCALTLAASPAAAADPEILGAYTDWTAYTFTENGNKVCYMASEPKKAEGNYDKRGDVFVLVTHRPADKTRDVVSVVAGYPYKAESEVRMTIDGRDTSLFTHGERAWARDTATDRKLVESMKAGRQMVVKGSSERGTNTTDTYSLSGFTAAHDAITKACGL
ncbi:MAG: invasion associated locus B family protein [Caenispirillum bisanense]|nr:invasion associated locus B family protein [Caenispirillum bisanense]MCA1971965.1 invasion associated locus B family protein [Caenispirillum sp.]